MDEDERLEEMLGDEVCKDNSYLIARTLLRISDQLNETNRLLSKLGTNRAGTEQGALEIISGDLRAILEKI